MKKIAFLFPGQGSQSVGMGQDIYREYDFVREIFDKGRKATGIDIAKLCFEGSMADLTQTVNLQPAVTAVNLSFLSILNRKGISADICAGHSLGEYSALCAAGVISETDALALTHRRGELMHREALKHKGAMAAIIGLPIEAVRELVEEADGVVSVANHNAETQIVITGAPEPVKKVSEAAAKKNAKAVPLKVSGAWHSALIQGAEAEFEGVLQSTVFSAPAREVVHNVTAGTEQNPEEIRSLMARQLCSPVRWYDTVLKLMSEKATVFVEVGPGKVLTGLVKKILPREYDREIYNVNDISGLDAFLKAVG